MCWELTGVLRSVAVICAVLFLNGCFTTDTRLVEKFDSKRIAGIPDGLYCQVTSPAYKSNPAGSCINYWWDPAKRPYSFAESKDYYYTMPLDQNLVLAQQTNAYEIYLFKVTDRGFNRISGNATGAAALAKKHGITLKIDDPVFRLLDAGKAQYLSFFRDLGKGTTVAGQAATINDYPEIHESLIGETDNYSEVFERVQLLKAF